MLIPLLTAEFVDREQVLTMSEFGNLLSVAQVTPGPVGLNTATYVGYVNEGFFGSLAASLGLIVPTILIGCSAAAGINRWKETFLVKGMLKGTRLAAVALIMFAVTIFFGMSIFTQTIPWESLGALFKLERPVLPDGFALSPAGILICGATIVLMLKTKLPTTALLLGAAAAGAILSAWF
jgi:chromate transporter